MSYIYHRYFVSVSLILLAFVIFRQTFLGGESYAGQYIPYIASAILNSKLPTASNLEGLLIGNGWIDPWNQYPAYLDFALDAGVIKKGSDAEAKVRKEVERCKASIEKGGKKNMKIHSGTCEGILGSITDSTIQSCVMSLYTLFSYSKPAND